MHSTLIWVILDYFSYHSHSTRKFRIKCHWEFHLSDPKNYEFYTNIGFFSIIFFITHSHVHSFFSDSKSYVLLVIFDYFTSPLPIPTPVSVGVSYLHSVFFTDRKSYIYQVWKKLPQAFQIYA